MKREMKSPLWAVAIIGILLIASARILSSPETAPESALGERKVRVFEHVVVDGTSTDMGRLTVSLAWSGSPEQNITGTGTLEIRAHGCPPNTYAVTFEGDPLDDDFGGLPVQLAGVNQHGRDTSPAVKLWIGIRSTGTSTRADVWRAFDSTAYCVLRLLDPGAAGKIGPCYESGFAATAID